jgi:hypothetical protein
VNVLVIVVYVDDIIVTGSSKQSILEFKKQMAAEFQMSDLGLLKYYLAIEVEQHEAGISIKQHSY